MRLIQPLKFRILKTGCFKMPRLQTLRLQTGVFQTVITVASELRVGNFNEMSFFSGKLTVGKKYEIKNKTYLSNLRTHFALVFSSRRSIRWM